MKPNYKVLCEPMRVNIVIAAALNDKGDAVMALALAHFVAMVRSWAECFFLGFITS